MKPIRLFLSMSPILLISSVWASTDLARMQTVGRFAIDTHEVSVAQFARFVQATGTVTQAEKSGGGLTYEGGWVQRKGWHWRAPYGLPAKAEEPAVHITYGEAQAFCRWAGKRLPLDAEWMEAAYTERRANPTDGFVQGKTYPYPTGTQPLGAHCLEECGNAAPQAAAKPTFTSRGVGHVKTGSTQAGVNGLWDMGGNVWEWTQGGDASARPTRGGSWWYGAAQMHRDHLQSKSADTAAVYIGFRCAKALP
jgi:formylglycine-generating enzyme